MRTCIGLSALAIIAIGALPASGLSAQSAASLGDTTRSYVTVSQPVVVLANATIIDGTGSAPRANQTIVIRDGKIAQVGPSTGIQTPAGARVMDLQGQTVIPGLVGMHDHLFYTAAGGRQVLLGFTGPRLYLASGVTTIRTTGATGALCRHQHEARHRWWQGARSTYRRHGAIHHGSRRWRR